MQCLQPKLDMEIAHTDNGSMKPTDRLKYALRIERRRGLTLFVRTLSLVFIPLYVWGTFSLQFEWYRYTLAYFIGFFILASYWSLIVNGGAFFITTEAARRYPLTATGCYLPTVLTTPIVLGGKIDYIIIATLFFGSIFIYFRLNPWKT